MCQSTKTDKMTGKKNNTDNLSICLDLYVI
jgi:hypothetical protein